MGVGLTAAPYVSRSSKMEIKFESYLVSMAITSNALILGSLLIGK